MKNLLSIIAILLLFSCKTQQPITQSVTNTDSVYESNIVRIDTVWQFIPADSLLMLAFVECDSSNTAYMRQIELLQSGQKVILSVNKGVLKANFICLADSFAALAKFREIQHRVYKANEKAITVTKIVKVYPAKWIWWIAGLSVLINIVGIYIKIKKFTLF